MENIHFTRFCISVIFLGKSPFKLFRWCFNFFRAIVLILLPVLLSACGGGNNSKAESPQVSSPASSSSSVPNSFSSSVASLSSSLSSISSEVDTIPPVLSDAKADIANDVVVLSVTANDNVKLASVSFIVDDEAINSQEQNTSGRTYSITFPSWVRGAGTHNFVAIAVDVAGNSISSEKVNFVIGNNPDTVVGNAAPTVSNVEVDGNFGLVRFKAIVKDDVKLFDIEFLVDGKATGWAEHLNTRSGAPENQYYVIFDTSSLTSGPHRLVVKARDYDSNITTSDEVIFSVDPTAGLIEIEPNNDAASANIIADNQYQLAGTLKNTKINSRVNIDYDYYKVSLPAGKTLTVNTLALPSTIFVSILDANGNIISGESASEGEASYTNGGISSVVYVRVSSGPIIYVRDQYKLSWSFR